MENENRIELDVFAVKEGIRYKIKTINVNDASLILTNSIMDGIGKIIGAIDNDGGIKNEPTNNM